MQNSVGQPLQQSEIQRRRRKAIINMQHIFAPKNNGVQRKDDIGVTLTFSCLVQPNLKNNFTLPEPVKCCSSQIVYNEEVSSNQCQVEGLHFVLMGHNANHDFSAYESCVKSIEFNGHFEYTRPAFHIMSQLKALENVHFLIGGASQLACFNEANEAACAGEIAPPNPNVKSLNVRVDMKNYRIKSMYDITQKCIMDIVESVLQRAGQCFPNLERLYVEVPCTGKSANMTEALIASSFDRLKGKLMISYCPFSEAIFVIPVCKLDGSNGLDLDDVLIESSYSRNSEFLYEYSHLGNARSVQASPGNMRSVIYYGRNYSRQYLEGQLGIPEPVVVQMRRYNARGDVLRHEGIIQRLRQENILGNNHPRDIPFNPFRPNGPLPVYDRPYAGRQPVRQQFNNRYLDDDSDVDEDDLV